MRIDASEVLEKLAQTVKDRQPDMQDYSEAPVTHTTYVNHFKAEALEFLQDYLAHIDFPSSISLMIVGMKGFDHLPPKLEDAYGLIIVNIGFKSRINSQINMSLSVPIYKGKAQKPSIVMYNNKKHVFSQDFINAIIESTRNEKPVAAKPYSADHTITHREEFKKDLFSAPHDPSDWSTYLTQRY